MKKIVSLFIVIFGCASPLLYGQKFKAPATFLRTPTITRLNEGAFYHPRIAGADRIKKYHSHRPYEIPTLNRIHRENFKKTNSTVVRQHISIDLGKHTPVTSGQPQPDISLPTLDLPEKSGKIQIFKGKVFSRLEDESFQVSEIEIQGRLRDHNGRTYQGNEIRDNLDRFEDVEKTLQANLLDAFMESGYTPSKLLLDFNKPNGYEFDLLIFHSSDPNAEPTKITDLPLRTKIYVKPVTRAL